MKLSEAILLGSTLVKPVRGQIDDGNGGGCAYGMANRSSNSTFANPAWGDWDHHTELSQLPCGCSLYKPMMGADGNTSSWYGQIPARHAIIHIFNQHVCDGDWTIERLAEWVASIEPPDPAEETARTAIVLDERAKDEAEAEWANVS